jgi:ferredoxin-type protein NapH
MLGFMVVVAVGYFIAGGIGNVCGIGFDTITLICPLGALLVMIAERTFIPLAVVSIAAVILICVLFGKVFCSWGCAVRFLSRRSKSGRTKARPASEQCAKGLQLDSRHGVLAGAVVGTLIFGFPVFCLACPVGLTFATVLLVMRLFAFGETTWTLVVFPLIIAAELFLLPRWCNNFCPLGALLSLFSRLNRTFRPQVNADTCLRTAQGTSCNLCERVCPEGINLHNPKAGETALNDCNKCHACADICPEHAISFPLRAKKDVVHMTEKGD